MIVLCDTESFFYRVENKKVLVESFFAVLYFLGSDVGTPDVKCLPFPEESESRNPNKLRKESVFLLPSLQIGEFRLIPSARMRHTYDEYEADYG